jgi:hypothetical protein
MTLTLSSLPHTWVLDLDGTIVEHNGYKKYGHDVFLDGAKEFLCSIPEDDMIIFLTSRTTEYSALTEEFLSENNIKFNHIIYGAPYGERILVNDDKPSGLDMAKAIRKERDEAVDIHITLDNSL